MSNFKSFTIHLIVLLTTLASFGTITINFSPTTLWAAVGAEAATIESVNSGNWSDPTVWSGGSLPQAGDAVIIHSGHIIKYDVVKDAVLGQVTIEGVLHFSREVDTRLKLGSHLLVRPGGYLDLGTATEQIPQGIRAELIFVLTEAQANSFVGFSRDSHEHQDSDETAHFQSSDIGLWVFEQGRWDVHGATLLRTWSKLASDAVTGAQTVVVENSVRDWYVGGKVVVTSTRNPNKYHVRERDNREMQNTYVENETRTIQALEVLEDGRTQITLDAPLEFAHSGTAPFQGEVALLTRNVLVSTELVGVDEGAHSDVRTRKYAHTMFMPGAKGNLEYGEFKRLGHYGILGRYPIHHHRMLETSKGMIVRGNGIWETGFRCVNLHITHGVLVEDNVCFNSTSTAFFAEEDEREQHEGYQRGYNQDNVFIHNIAIATHPKHFDDRNNDAIAGDSRRMAAFWPGSETQHEAYLGNVVVGGKEFGDSAGFGFPEKGNSIASQGIIPFTFVHNEVHSSVEHGIHSWQNVGIARDFVDTRLWRNGNAGIRWGAYRMPAFYFNAQLLENGKSGLDITSINPFLQDSIITGDPTDGSRTDRGFDISGYIMPQYPGRNAWVVRNVFKNLKTSGISQPQKAVPGDNIGADECDTHDFDPNPPFDLKLRSVHGGECSGVYITLMGNQFENVPTPLDFGQAPNPNSWWKVFDFAGNGALPEDFVLVRSDQGQSARQGVITQDLVTTEAATNDEINALLIPMSSLPQEGIEFTGLLNHRPQGERTRSEPGDFTFATQPDYPPTVTLDVTVNGNSVTLKATATDDKGLARLEFFVDWVNVATHTVSEGTTSTVHEVTIDLSNHPTKYAYLYVRAFDGIRQIGEYEQRAYSNVVELGPEILGSTPQPAVPGIPVEPGKPGGSGEDDIQLDHQILLPSVKS